MTAQIVSKLSQFLKTGLKEGATIAGERVEKEALRAGVKPEELDFAKLPVDPNKRYTQSELSALDRERDDIIGDFIQAPKGVGKADGVASYGDIVLNKFRGNPNYRERITQFSKSSDIANARATKEKIAEYWKKRNAAATPEERQAIRDEAEAAGVPTYTLYQPTVDDAINMFNDQIMGGRYMSEHFDGTPDYLMHTRYADDALQGKSTRVLMEIQSDLHQQARIGEATERHKENPSPWKNSWLRKGIELELVDAHNKGIEQVAIPISSEHGELPIEVLRLADKLDDISIDVDDDVEGAEEVYRALEAQLYNILGDRSDAFYAMLADNTYLEAAQKLYKNELAPLSRGEGVQKWYETEVLNTAKKIAKATGSEFEEVVDDGVKYAVIRPTGPFTTTLYASPVAAYFAARTAFDEGYNEEEVRAYTEQNGYDYDELKAAADKIAQAREAGYTDEEIKQFLERQVPVMPAQELPTNIN